MGGGAVTPARLTDVDLRKSLASATHPVSTAYQLILDIALEESAAEISTAQRLLTDVASMVETKHCVCRPEITGFRTTLLRSGGSMKT